MVGCGLRVGGTGTLHRVWTLTPVVRGVVAIADGDDIASGNWRAGPGGAMGATNDSLIILVNQTRAFT